MKRLAVLLLAAIPVLAACNPVMVGDSIFDMMRSEATSRFPDSKVNASPGRGAYNPGYGADPGTGLQAIQTELPNVTRPGGWLVVELGSNNLTFAQHERIWFIMQVVGLVPDDICIAWVVPWGVFNDVPAQAWGADLDQWLRNQPCYKVIHWEDVAPAHPEWFYDGVHPSAAGKQAMLCMIGQAIGKPC